MAAFSVRAVALPATVFLSLILGGCRSPESEMAGTWTGSEGSMTVTSKHRFSAVLSGMPFEGTWELEGNDAVFTALTWNKVPMAEAKRQFLEMVARTGKNSDQTQLFADDLEKPSYFVLSDDGKSMTTDKHRDPNGGPSTTFTKQSL